jgi:membrane associated rhomboid family serine protease
MPPVIKNLLIANAAVFFLTYLLRNVAITDSGDSFSIRSVSAFEMIIKYFAFQPIFADYPHYTFFPWQLITYQFLHANFSHIFFNMLALWMFGMEIENVWGSKKFLLFYLTAGIGGAVFQALASLILGVASAPTIGASGSVYGVMIAFALLFPDRPVYIYFLLPIKSKYLIPGLIFIEIFAVGDPTGVAHLVHIGGALTALIFMMADKNIHFTLKNMLKRGGARTYDYNDSPRDYENPNRTYWKPYEDDTPRQQYRPSQPAEDARYRDVNEEQITQADIDEILDKISKYGYQNLTTREKQILFEASKRMK